MALIETWLKQDIDQMVPVQRLDGNIFSGDNKGNLIGVEVYRGKESVNLSGVCIGYFMRADGTTILLDGELDGNKAHVTLNNSCYAVAGQFSLVLKNGATTIAACTGRVYRCSTDVIEEGESTLATIEDLLAQLDKIAFAEREIDPVLSGPDSNGRWIVGAELKRGTKYKIHDKSQLASTLPAGASPYMYNPGGSRVIAMEEIGDDDAFYFDGLEFTYGKSTGSSADSSSGSSGSGSGSGGDEEVVVVEEDVVPADEEVVPAEEEETDPVDNAYFSEITAAWAATIYFTQRTNVLDFWQDVARSVSKEFYPEKSYQAGEYCYRNGRFYRFLYDHEGAWAPGDVEDATVGDGLFRNDLAMSLYARNISNVELLADEIEGEWYDYKENVDASVATIDEMESTLTDLEDIIESLGLTRLARLNRPNLLKQNWWTNREDVGHLVVYGRDSRISGNTYPYLSSYNSPTETTQTTEPTAAQKAAATAIYVSTEEGVTTWHIFIDDDDIRATVAELAAADQITEPDGESYAKAINFDITANSSYGNCEWLMYYNPYFSRTYNQGATNVQNYGQIEEMEPGQKYTASCWVRVLSGDGAWLRMGYGNSYSNQPYNDTENNRTKISDWIKVEPKNGEWQRIHWTFDFNPAGDWYTETSEVVDGVTKITRSYNWYKKVCFGIGRKHTAVVQMCGFRLVAGDLLLPTKYDTAIRMIEEISERVDDLEEMIINNGGN